VCSSDLYQDGWRQIVGSLENPDTLVALNRLVGFSQAKLLGLPESPEWANQNLEVSYRWQQMIELATTKVIQGRFDRSDKKNVDEADLLRTATAELLSCIDEHGWAQEGIIFYMPLNGFGEGTTKEFDIREMGPVVSAIDMDFVEFKSLSDEEVDRTVEKHNRLVEHRRKTGRVSFGEVFDYPPLGQIWRDTNKLQDFLEWRKYGKPDRELSYQEEMANLIGLIEYQITQDPEYGKPPEAFNGLSLGDKQKIGSLFMYFDGMRDIAERMGIDTYSLLSTMGFEESDVESFVQNGVLTNEGEFMHPGIGTLDWYNLTQPYYEYWLVDRVLGYRDHNMKSGIAEDEL